VNWINTTTKISATRKSHKCIDIANPALAYISPKVASGGLSRFGFNLRGSWWGARRTKGRPIKIKGFLDSQRGPVGEGVSREEGKGRISGRKGGGEGGKHLWGIS